MPAKPTTFLGSGDDIRDYRYWDALYQSALASDAMEIEGEPGAGEAGELQGGPSGVYKRACAYAV